MRDEFYGIAQAQPCTHIAAVLSYRVFADAQRVRNVLATKAFGHRFEYIDFTRSECRRDDFICCWMLSIEMAFAICQSYFRSIHGMSPISYVPMP